jgi:hypothetical protein
MNVYRVFDKHTNNYIKIGKRTNDLYKSKPLVVSTLKRYYNIDNVEDRFSIIEYELVRTNKKERN